MGMTNMAARRPASVLQELPPVWASSLLDSIRGRRCEANRCLIVLDDDPMSGQALYDVPVLTTWNVNALAAEMLHSDVIVLLTETRSLEREDALDRMREVGRIVREAAGSRAGRSTLPCAATRRYGGTSPSTSMLCWNRCCPKTSDGPSACSFRTSARRGG